MPIDATGLVQDLEDRYNRLRLECQLAVDKAESVSESELIRRALSKEKGTSAAKGFFGGAVRYAFRPCMLACFWHVAGQLCAWLSTNHLKHATSCSKPT